MTRARAAPRGCRRDVGRWTSRTSLASPTWEKEVFDLFDGSFGELKSIFDQYAKSGTAGSASAGAAMTMQQTELQNLALDCQLSSEQFSMTRVINIFKRADQVDDTFQVSAADKRVVTGETAKMGDHGLELHEFFECLVMLALQRANPKLGEVGHNSSVQFPLPGCLLTLLNNHCSRTLSETSSRW